MTTKPAVRWGLGLIGVLAVGAAAWYIFQQEDKGEILSKIGDAADEARSKASGIAKTLRDKATPLLQTVGDLVEKNAELVSALANVPADQIRKTGADIKEMAVSLEKNLEGLANI